MPCQKKSQNCFSFFLLETFEKDPDAVTAGLNLFACKRESGTGTYVIEEATHAVPFSEKLVPNWDLIADEAAPFVEGHPRGCSWGQTYTTSKDEI